MTHGCCRLSVDRKLVPARRQALTVAALLLTAGAPIGALAGSTAATDGATVTIRVSVAPIYGLTRASHAPFQGDAEAKLCIRTNAASPTLPITGGWLDPNRPDPKIVLPSCGGLPSPTALRQALKYRPSRGRIFLVSPE